MISEVYVVPWWCWGSGILIRGLVVSDRLIYIHAYAYIYILCFKSFEELIGFFLYFSIYIYIIHNQISIYVNRRSNKRHRMSNISMILRVHIHGDALIPHTHTYTHTHTHTYKYYADRPRDPMSVPKALLSLGLFLLLTGETVRECAVWRGQWMGIGDVAIFSEVEWPLHPSIYIMVYSQCFRGVQDVKTGLLIYTTSLAK